MSEETSNYARGHEAVQAFVDLQWPEGFTPHVTRSGAPCDCVIHLPGQRYIFIEVKRASTKYPVGQLRPLRYQVVVIWREPAWWIIPPHQVIELALGYSGQHCTNPLECFSPGKPRSAWNRWRCSSSQVPERVFQAAQLGDASPLKLLVPHLREDITTLAARQAELVRAAIANAQ
jgi:hypothetical protein